MPKRLWAIGLMTALAPSARAQLHLPGLPLSVPQTVQGLTQTVNTATTSLAELSDTRHLEVKRLVRSNRRVLDTDPNGEAVVRDEILALNPSDEATARALTLGYSVERERTLGDLRVVVFKAPPKASTNAAVKVLRDADPQGVYDYNHIYIGSGGRGDQDSAHAAAVTPSSQGPAAIRVGLVDTGVDASHPIFRDAAVHAWGCDKPLPDPHGTAVASLLLAPAHTELYAADVYCGKPTGGAVDAIVASLAWMSSEHIPVINMSLVGPRNALLEHAVSALLAGGCIVVAAVGNDGPTAPPLFPAAYAGVVGVTGVDAARRVLIEAVRGPQVMFAARGAEVKAATTHHSFIVVRGTSFAAPVVAELLAERLQSPDRAMALAAIDALSREAIDLGPPGRDLTYGFGFVGAGRE